MTTFNFVQVNNRNLSETIAQIDSFANTFIIGFEVVNSEIIKMLDVNIDPQHTGVKWYEKQYPVENVSAAKWLLKKLPTLPQHENITCVIEKLDIDALVALVLFTKAELLSNFENDPVHHEAFLELCERVNAIDAMDCGLGNSGVEWNPEYHKQNQVREITPFNVLGSMCSDFRCDIDFKRDAMLRWLTLGDLPQKYVEQVTQELNAQKDSVVKENFYYFPTDDGGEKEIELYFVQSTARGATGILYSHAPFGVCYNPEFPVKDGIIRKFTICEFTAGKYLDLQGILDEIAQIEQGWGGNLNAGIIGSPFAGTELARTQVCEIVAKHVK
jgi:hypothetical protein